MVNSELNPREWRDIQVLRARGVLAEVLVVDLVEADHALWAYAHATGTSLQEVARQVRDRELIIDRESCVMPAATRGTPRSSSARVTLSS